MRALFDGIPLRADEHLDDDQRHGHVAAGAVPGRRRGAGRRHRRADRHHAERHHQGVPVPRHVRLPAGPLGPADHRRDRLHGGPHAQVEPGQRLQLPPAGGRGHPGAGDRLRAVHRDRPCWTRSATPGRSPRSGWARWSRGSPSSSTRASASSRRCARCGRSPGSGTRITRERYGIADPAPPPLPLRRAGQLAGPDRGAAGEQRPADRAGDAGRHPVPRRPGPRRPAARLERGAGPAPALGPAVEPAHPAGARVRVGPAGVRRPVRRVRRGGGQDRRAGGRRRGGDRPGSRRWAGWCRGGVRLPQGPAGRLARGPAGPDRVRRGQGRGGQLLPGHRAQSAHRGRRHGGPPGGPGLRARGAGRPGSVARPARRGGGARRPRPAGPTRRGRTST